MDAKHSADPFARYRIVGTAAALLILLLGVKDVWQNFTHPGFRDFINFWCSARFAMSGTPALAYDPQALHHLQSSVATIKAGNEMPFPYMPAYILLVLPFGLFSYPLGMALWVGATLLLYLLALKRLVPQAGLLALAFPPILVTIALGQNGFLTAALLITAVAMLDRRPFAAGVLAGLLILKPQLGLFLPVALIASRQWRAIAGAALSAVCISLSGVLLFGTATLLAWIRLLPLLAKITKDGMIGWIQLTSVYAAGRQAGLDAATAMALHVLIALAAATVVWITWRSDRDKFAKAAILAAATALASPYLFLYDLPILMVPILWLARSRVHPAAVAVPWFLSAFAIAQHFGSAGPINLNPIISIVLLALTARQQRKDRTEETLTSGGKSAPAAQTAQYLS